MMRAVGVAGVEGVTSEGLAVVEIKVAETGRSKKKTSCWQCKRWWLGVRVAPIKCWKVTRNLTGEGWSLKHHLLL